VGEQYPKEKTNMAKTENTEVAEPAASAESEGQIKGRCLFAVEMTPLGVSVHTAMLTEDQKLMKTPAIFPDVEYALAQIDHLRRLVLQQFSNAARLGAQLSSQSGKFQAHTEQSDDAQKNTAQ
jgi:hypothetical protein